MLAPPEVRSSAPPTTGASADAGQAAERVGLTLLGGFELLRGGQLVSLPASAQRLLALLAVRERPASRLWVAGTLWPDRDEARGAANLRSTLWRLRQPNLELVAVSGDRLSVSPSVDVDLHRARTLAWAILHGGAALDHPDHVPAELVAGDLLPDWYDDWVLVEQERVRQLRLHALEELSGALVATGRGAAAVEAGLLAVRCDPLRESAQRALIRAHLAEGNRADALRHYRSYEALLAGELGIAPSPDLGELCRCVPTNALEDAR